MRHILRVSIASTIVAFGTTACGGAGEEAAVVVAAPAAPAVPAAPPDPYAWTDITYAEYRSAALQVPIRPEFLVTPAALTQSLDTLCTTNSAGFTELLTEHRKRSAATGDAAGHRRYLGEEVSLRLGLACPQRMLDWSNARAAAEQAPVIAQESRSHTAAETERGEAEPEVVEGETMPDDPYIDHDDDGDAPGSVAGGGGGG